MKQNKNTEYFLTLTSTAKFYFFNCFDFCTQVSNLVLKFETGAQFKDVEKLFANISTTQFMLEN